MNENTGDFYTGIIIGLIAGGIISVGVAQDVCMWKIQNLPELPESTAKQFCDGKNYVWETYSSRTVFLYCVEDSTITATYKCTYSTVDGKELWGCRNEEEVNA